MNQIRPHESPPFQSVAAFYHHRLSYPQRLIQRLTALTGLVPGDAVLDLGTGPGLLAVPFAQAGMTVTAADPEPQMLEAAAAASRMAGVTLSLWQGGSGELTPEMGPYKLVAIGRAFHWMDRVATLRMLDRIIAPGGAVALFHDAHPDVPENRWFKTVREIGDRYSKDPRIPGRKTGGHRRYEPYLFESAFTQLDGLSVTSRAEITLDEIVGRAYSMSGCTPARLGDRQADFEKNLRAALMPLAQDGRFIEIAEMVAVLARRPEQRK